MFLRPPIESSGRSWMQLVEVARRWPFWVAFSLWVFPWLWTLAWLLFILEPFLLHLSSKQLLRHFEKSSSDHRPHITPLRWWQWVPRKGCLLSGSVALTWSFPQLAVITYACLVSCDTCFLPCPWGLSSSCWLLGFAEFAMWYYYFFVCRVFLQGKRQ